MDEKRQPGISFDGIILAKENFWRDYSVPEEATPDMSINVSWNNQGDHWVTEFSFSLRLMYEETRVLQLDSTFIAFFSVVQGEENMDMERFVQSHSPALMFPYIREHISAVTQKAGVKPVLLAPVNVLAMLKDAKGRTSDADEADQFVSLDPGE